MMRPGRVTADSAISRVLRQRQSPGANETTWNLEYTSAIPDRAAFNQFPWELAANVDLADFHNVRHLLPPKMKAIALSGKIFTLSWMLMGFENFCESLAADDGLAADVLRRVAEIQLSALDRLLALDHVGAVWAVDDIAYNTGPMLSPDHLRQYLFPWYRQIAKRCHDAGRFFVYHSDGNLNLVLPDLIDLGLDALHPLDPTAMDILQTKKSYGHKLALFGNVDTELLRNGTPQQVADRTGELLRTIAPGGGFALGSGNSVPDWAQFQNYQAMRQTVLDRGHYPIKI
jgi:uroporphyrinogen decarboxylase